MKVWLVIFLGGLMTFGMRFSLIFLFGKFEIPDSLRRALHYVPPAVLSAIVFPELFYSAGAFSLSLDNSRLLAGAAAILAAWLSKNTLLTIFTGMTVLLVLQVL
ncbi:MAG: AzlD domain-containing protein [Chloroflexi bacterium]|nr:AzlD domain-containing protein [Chloroflexota bacterium]